MTFHAKRRDAVERLIIDALQAVGASVQQLDVKGGPDLLCGYEGRNVLLECKDPIKGARHSTRGRKTATGMRLSQEAWWAAWKGATPIVVHNADEALVAIGALRSVAPLRDADWSLEPDEMKP